MNTATHSPLLNSTLAGVFAPVPGIRPTQTWLHELRFGAMPAPKALQAVRVPARLELLDPDQLVREVGEW